MDKVLIIDDEPDALEVLSWMLSDHGCEVRAESDAERALEVARAFEPNVVITDYHLGEHVSGVDVIRQLRETNPGIRAVLMTGMPLEDLKAELQRLGPVEVLHKPFVWDDLMGQLALGVRPCA